MSRTLRDVFVAICFALCLTIPMAGRAQVAVSKSLMDALYEGKFGPVSITLSDLPDGARAFSIEAEGSYLDLFRVGMIYDGGRGKSNDPLASLADYASVIWILPGSEDDLNGSGYVLAYRAQLSTMASMMSYGEDMTTVPPLTLRLSLVRLTDYRSITPRPDLTKQGWLDLTRKPVPLPTEVKKTVGLSNMKQVALAALMYATDYDDLMPDADSADQAKKEIMPYLKSADLFISQNPNGGHVLYNTHLARVPSTAIESPANTVMFYDSLAWPDGSRPVAFADGHVKIVSSEQWPTYAATLQRRFTATTAPTPKPLYKPRKPLKKAAKRP